MKKAKNSEGQGLMEVLIAITVLMVVATGLLMAVTVSIKNVEFAKKKSIASICVQEGLEQSRYERENRVFRDDTTSDFYHFVEGVAEGRWYLDEALDWETTEPSTPNYQETFIRSVRFEEESGMVKATAVCAWTDSSGTHQSQAITYFSDWK